MHKFVQAFGALVALFSFSACSISTPKVQHYEAASPYQVGSAQGLVYPTDLSHCFPDAQAPQDGPLPRNVPHATWYNTGSPPKRFQKDVKVMVYFQNPNIINRGGGYHNRPFCGSTVFAYSDPDSKTMNLPNPCDYPQTDAYARLICHELGHINGWPAYHGD